MGDLYELGCSDDDAVGDRYVTPRAMADEMTTVDNLIRQLTKDVESASLRPKFKEDFRVFVDEWRRFKADHESFTARLWPITYDKILDFRRRTVQWQEAFRKEGGTPNSPRPAAAPPTRPERFTSLGWLIVAGVVGAFLGSAVQGAKE